MSLVSGAAVVHTGPMANDDTLHPAPVRMPSRARLLGLLTLAGLSSFAAACTSDGADPLPPPVPVDPIPLQSGAFVGHYRVPVSAELTGAALFAVPHVDWTVAGGIATLHYALPVGLVGGVLDVTFTGALAAGDTQLAVTGTDGSGLCVAQGTVITCQEQFANLGALPISMLVVQQTSAREYAGPVIDRTTVASVFGSDPIGIVDFDLSVPAVDDNGGGGGGSP